MVQGGLTKSSNPGFERGGFRNHVVKMLSVIFPERGLGGVICCIDNLELLQESEIAKQKLEQLRDNLLQIQGLCWVLCGALGITYGVASSPRLDGYLHRPIELSEVDKSLASDILKSRISAYSRESDPYLPITQTSFDQLYEILKGNLRTVLSYTGNYCQAAADGKLPQGDAEKNAEFQAWLSSESEAAYEVARSALTPKTMEVFHIATSGTGTFSPSDYEKFDTTSMQALRPYIKSLEDVSLLQSVKDDKDQRRKTIQVTAKGWLVEHYVKKHQEVSPVPVVGPELT